MSKFTFKEERALIKSSSFPSFSHEGAYKIETSYFK